MTDSPLLRFSWIGNQNPYIDTPHIERCGEVIIGAYGGASRSRAVRNEDAAYVLTHPDGEWCFAALIDGHYSCESDELIIDTLNRYQAQVLDSLSLSPGIGFERLRSLLIEAFGSQAFRDACTGVVGEASAFFCAQKGRFVFWLSVGDCLGFALHPELARPGQFAMNQRHFYEWLGRSNVFDLEVPAFTSGVQELRSGLNTIALVTDGLYEYPGSPFEDPRAIYSLLGPDQQDSLEAGALQALQIVHRGHGRDSATIISWPVQVQERATRSSPAPRPF